MKTIGHGYSIWIAPDREHGNIFSKIINNLGRIFKSPTFEPHITLLGEIEGSKKDIIEKTKKLSVVLHPYMIETYRVDHEPKYFRALFVHVKKTKEVIRANQTAQEIFGMIEDYVPHLSLAYSRVPKSTKDEFTKDIKDTLKGNGHFMAKKICLYRTNGEVSKWRLIKTFPLKNKKHHA